MPTYNPGGFSGTLGECVQAVAEVDSVKYYKNLVQDELEDLLESYDSLYGESQIKTKSESLDKVKELLEEKIEIINGAM
tara:strand:- start:1464 stop:1700 length:237 start_codon:yes stop_codon:yes gene_type:complete